MKFDSNKLELTEGELERFWKYVSKGDGCWNWIGSIDLETKYGRFHLRSFSVTTHRLSYYIHKGAVKNHVLHSCDNRACVNPDHLVDGTNLDNINDRIAKGRTWSKVTKEQELEIVKLYESMSQYEIARLYNITQSGVYRVLKRNGQTLPRESIE